MTYASKTLADDPALDQNKTTTKPETFGTSFIPTRIIIFWNKFWNNYVYDSFGIEKGPEAFKNCHYKNCYITKDRSLLYNPKYIISAIVFFGVAIQQNEFKKIKKFKKNQKLVRQKNGGITPKIVLFMRVIFFIQ